MEAFVIRGGKALCGTVEISGAKNAVLPILAATVLRGGKYILRNCPDITDVHDAVQILQLLGARVTRVGNLLTVDTGGVCSHVVPPELMQKMRASVLFLGPLLARFGAAVLTMPGGCPIGRRPIDLHLEAMSRMGAAVTLMEDCICCRAPRLHGGVIELDFPSVGATENAVMAAVRCRGTVVLKNAAREPEVCDLMRFLQSMGADIRGIGTGTVTIRGGVPLHDTDYTVMADRMETATYLCAAAGCGGEVTLLEADAEDVRPILQLLRKAGCKIELGDKRLTIRSSGRLTAVGDIQTQPHPGFPTDAQALMMAAMLRAEGESRFSETVFEQRFGHVPQLLRHGAAIEVTGHMAVVRGVQSLFPAQTRAGDLRAAAALIIAALQSPGESRVFGLKHLYRGYDNPEGKFCALGAEIRCVQ